MLYRTFGGTYRSIRALNSLTQMQTRFNAIKVGILVAMVVAVECDHQTPQRNAKLSYTHFLLGDDLLRKKEPDGAKRELLKALELDPDNKDAYQLLGVVFFMEGLQKVNILERENCLKGIAAEEQRKEVNKEFRRSEGYLLKAVHLAEKQKKIESDGLNYLANIALHFKRYDEAIALCKKALENILFTSRQLALGTLGWAYYNKGDRISAARELRQAVFHEPKFCVGRYRLARVYYQDKIYEKAIEELKKITEDKMCPIQEAFQLLGLALLKQKDAEQARLQFEQCIKLYPTSCISEECRNYMKLL